MRVDLSWTVDRVDGVWFVACRLHNPTEVARRVRLDSRLDGPVLPPRRRGVPEAGWDATGLTLELGPDERRGVGFACPLPSPRGPTTDGDQTPPAPDPPVAITGCSPVDPDGPPSTPTVADAVRRLGDHRPPRAVVTDVGAGTDVAATSVTSTTDGDPGAVATEETEDGQPGDGDVCLETTAAITAWVNTVEGRIERAERLTNADLETATAALERVGSAADAVDVAHQVDADVARLTRLADRASSLAARAEATDVPVEALESIA